MKNKVLVTFDSEKKKLYYNDAFITKVYEDSFDIRLPNGKIYKYVQNSSNLSFNTGDYVSILFSDDQKAECKIIGTGKKITSVENIPIVRV